MRSRSVSSFVAAALVAASTITAAHATTSPRDVPAVGNSTGPTIDWKPCRDVKWLGYNDKKSARWLKLCGEMSVPLDHSRPSGERVTVRLIKPVSTEPDSKPIFVLRGAVGEKLTFGRGSVVEWHKGLRDQYYKVEMDPRGVGYSNEFRCARAKPGEASDDDHLPVTNAEMTDQFFDDLAFKRECARNKPKIADFMTTADFARDLDYARRAENADKMNIVGSNYGAHVAATYMNLFPQQVGAIVMDSVFDSTAYTRPESYLRSNNPATVRTKRVHAARRAWGAVMAECEELGTESCHAAETVREDWEYIHRELPQRNITLNGHTITYARYVAAEVGAGRGARFQARLSLTVPWVAKALRAQATGADPAVSPALSHEQANLTWRSIDILRDFSYGTSHSDPRLGTLRTIRAMQPALGVMCGEVFNPVDPTVIRRTIPQQNAIKPGEGAARVWRSSACSQWPFRGKNAYRGDFRTPAANIPLILSNQFATETPHLEGALRMRDILPGARLVTVPNAYGSTAEFSSECARQAIVDYLSTQKVPDQDITCDRADHLKRDLKRLNQLYAPDED